MLDRPFTAWLRPVLTLFGLAGLLTLAACGGGSGAPNNPYTPPPPATTVPTLLPPTLTVYAGSPVTLTVSGGVAPYRAFSSDPTALPVPSAVSSNTIVLAANSVAASTTVSVTVQDSIGQVSTPTIVTVSPAPLLPSQITVTSSPNPACTNTTNAVCSGGTGTALVTVTGPGGAGIPNRQVRFDVVQGAFSIQTTNPGQPNVSTLTVVSDANGDASVVLAVAANTPTQSGVIRATDLTTGNQVTGNFTILQVETGGQVLSVLPQGITTITGPTVGVCSTGVPVTFYIFGGTPPYVVSTQFPGAVTLTGSPVQTSGGSYTIITNGTCFIGLTFVITDATGRTIPGGAYPTVTNEPGTTPVPPPPPGPVVATPNTFARTGCVPANTFQFIITGGTPPYSAVVTQTGSPTSPVITPQTGITSGTLVTVSGLTTGAATPTVVSIFDSSAPAQTTSVSITCN
jgi:hypothetical protein